MVEVERSMTAKERIEAIRDYLSAPISVQASRGFPEIDDLAFLLRMYDEALRLNVGLVEREKQLLKRLGAQVVNPCAHLYFAFARNHDSEPRCTGCGKTTEELGIDEMGG